MNTPTLSNADLIEELKQSALEGRQKTALEPLISKMTDTERQELLSLIEQSKKMITDEPKNKEQLAALNAEYSRKLDAVIKEETTAARKAFEKLDEEDRTSTLNKLESSINTTVTTLKPKTTHHQSRKFFLLLALLSILAVGAWMGLNILDNL